jgi:hypothetical protein
MAKTKWTQGDMLGAFISGTFGAISSQDCPLRRQKWMNSKRSFVQRTLLQGAAFVDGVFVTVACGIRLKIVSASRTCFCNSASC